MGFDTSRFIEKPPEDLLCAVCKDVCDDPVMCSSEHLFCRACVCEWLNEHEICPLDGVGLTISDLRVVQRVVRSWIAGLQLTCQFNQKGCDQILTVEQEHKHAMECKFNDLSDENVARNKKRIDEIRAEMMKLQQLDAMKKEQLLKIQATVEDLLKKQENLDTEFQNFKIESKQKSDTVKKSLKDKMTALVFKVEKTSKDNSRGRDEWIEKNLREIQTMIETDLEDKLSNAENILKFLEEKVYETDIANANELQSDLHVAKQAERSNRDYRFKVLRPEDLNLKSLCLVSKSQQNMMEKFEKRHQIENELLRDILMVMEFEYLQSNKSITQTFFNKRVIEARNICSRLKKNHNVLFIGGNELLAVIATIAVGTKGKVYGKSYSIPMITDAGFGNLLGQRLIVTTKVDFSYGYPNAAPYDVILVRTTMNWNINKMTLLEQLKDGGIAYDYQEGVELQ